MTSIAASPEQVKVHGNTKHGKVGTPSHCTWRNMLSRCRNPKNAAYPRYGGRGITVCKQWECFENFYRDMGDRPEGMTLDRIDNDGDYEPSNCRWATREEQQNNKRNNRLITIDGRTQTLTQWAKESKISAKTVHERLKLGWYVKDAICKPTQKLLKIYGVERTISQWSEISTASTDCIYTRLHRGWSPKEAVFGRAK